MMLYHSLYFMAHRDRPVSLLDPISEATVALYINSPLDGNRLL